MPKIAKRLFCSRKIRTIKPAERAHQKASPTYASGPMLSQQPMGNQAMQRMLQAKLLQAKLTINPPDDEHEKEADQVADSVMSMPAPMMPTPQKDNEEKRLQTKPLPGHNLHLIQRQEDETKEDEEEKPLQTKLLSGHDSLIQRQAVLEDEEKKNEEETPVQTKPLSGEESSILEEAEDERRKAHYKDDEGGLIQRKTASGKPGQTVDERFLHNLGSGQPLDHATRAFFEPRFGQDFSGVRIHTGAKAAESAASVQARAYTVGHSIVFGGKESASDLPVLAHELAHVVQQTGTAPVLQRLAFCRDFLEITTPYVAEYRVRDELAGDAAPSGKVERELSIPEGTAAGQRPKGGYTGADAGRVDVALLTGSTLEILEVKKATWGWGEWDPGAPFAEGQLERYLRKSEENLDGVTDNWRKRRRGNRTDEIASVKAMPMARLNLAPNPRIIDGDPVALRWCKDGIVVFKRQPQQEEKPEDKEPKDKGPGPGDTLPEKLQKLAEELLPILEAAGLLDIAWAMAAVLGSIVTSPLVALVAVILGIAFFWDQLKSLASKVAAAAQFVWDKIAGLAGFVWGKFTWILGKLHELGIKLAELGSWLAGKIVWLAEKLAEGLTWIGHRIAAGGRWVGRNIASAAEAIWDWLWGSDVEPMVPIIEMPVTEEPTQHCATVAHEDTIVKIGTDLLFPLDKWELKKEADDDLGKAAAKLVPMLQKDDRIIIEGYTDIAGSDEYNQWLSEQRAGAVASWFVEHGILPVSRIRVEGYGKTRAQAKYSDEEGRKKDRRVEIWVPKHGSMEKVCW